MNLTTFFLGFSLILLCVAFFLFVWAEMVRNDPACDNAAGSHLVWGLSFGYWACLLSGILSLCWSLSF